MGDEERSVGSGRLFDPRILHLLTLLTRTQAWLTPPEIARRFRPGGQPVSARTLHRWFAALEAGAGLAYFPYPRLNLLGLQEVWLRIHGLRNPAVLSTIPFSHSFFTELSLEDGRPLITQGYWIPHEGLKGFMEFWRTAKDLGVLLEAAPLPVRNSHFFFSPFEEVVGPDGWVAMTRNVDNQYFATLVRRHLREPFKAQVAEFVAKSPLIVPLVFEHLWGKFSSRHVWMHLEAKEGGLPRYGRGLRPQHEEKPGMALRLLQMGWQDLLRRFDDFFLQPVVFVPPGMFRNSILLSLFLRTGSTDRTVEATTRISEKSVFTSLMPGSNPQDGCRLWCTTPTENLPAVVRLVREHHVGPGPPHLGIIDVDATRRIVQPEFCRFDWRSFNPATVSWSFDGQGYLEELQALGKETPGSRPGSRDLARTKDRLWF